MTTRDSNMELLRIVAMSMVVIGHFIIHGIWNDEIPVFSVSTSVQLMVYSLAVIAVNCYFLISGYYQIKLR